MLDLSTHKAPFHIALPYGLSVTVRPLTTAGMAAAQAAARRAVDAIERQARERTEAGLALDGLPDLSAEGERDGFYQAQLIREIATLMEKEGVAYDIASYRDAPPGLRLWGGATAESGDMEAVLSWLAWAFDRATARSSAI